MAGAIIKIYSGVHLGAEISLKEGTWVFGRDDSADIILSDEGIAPRHIALTFSAGGIMRFEVLDGAVVMASGDAPTGGMLPAAALWRLGPVLMAWGPEGVEPNFWHEVEASVLALIAPAATVTPTSEATSEKMSVVAEESSSGEVESTDDYKPENDDAEKATEAKPKASKSKTYLGKTTTAIALLAFLGIGVMTFSTTVRQGTSNWLAAHAPVVIQNAFKATFETGGLGVLRQTLANAGLLGELPGPKPQAVEGMLWENGFDGIKVTRVDTGAYQIKGMVANDRDRAKLVEIARGFEWPVVLDVAVESDYTQAYQAAFNAIGFWPNVSIIRREATTDVTIAAYMISSVVEEKAFGDVAHVAPSVLALSSGIGTETPVRVVRRIRHQAEVRQWVDKALANEKPQNVTVEYLPGVLRFKTTLTPDQKTKLDRAMTALKAASDVPLQMDVVNVTPKALTTPIVAKTVTTTPKKARRASSGPSFRVVAVSGGALKFVTLSNGTKVFQGGMLPGGYRLEAVHADRLVLSKNKKRINYPLKVKK